MAVSRVIQWRSVATMMAMIPNPLPPVVTTSFPYCGCCVTSFTGKAADRMGEVPEIFESLFLNEVEQGTVGRVG